MTKSFTVVYKVHNGLYVNLTNRCSASCTFCLRHTREKMGESESLWLDHEPDFEEVKAQFEKFDVNSVDEIVFCGFGEPTERFDLLLEVAAWLKSKWNKSVRINTNGHGDLINGRHIAPEMKGLIDTVSISLNTPDAEKYNELVRSRYGIQSYQAMLDFAKEAQNYVTKVVLTTVDTTLTKEEEKQCAEICKNLGVTYRIRPWED